MKKASAKIRRKVKIKFCRELNSMNAKMSSRSSKNRSKRPQSTESKATNSAESKTTK